MTYTKTFTANSGHTMFVKSIMLAELPENIAKQAKEYGYTKFYVVKNWDDTGVEFMYLGTGAKGSSKEIVAWYRNGAFWSSFGNNIEQAVNGAQRDGWVDATRIGG